MTLFTGFEVVNPATVNVSAALGDYQLTIFGFSSPNSRVELTAPRVFAISYSDPAGYFIFDHTLLPANPSDLCLSSIDASHRHTAPVCFPPPPFPSATNIGPILLPPTLTQSAITASGQAIPNSLVRIHLYQHSPRRSVLAYSLPPLTIATDDSGNFNFNLPTLYHSHYRLFATTQFLQTDSPKSNTLAYTISARQSSLIFYLPLIILFLLLYLLFHRSRRRYLPALRQAWPVIINQCRAKYS